MMFLLLFVLFVGIDWIELTWSKGAGLVDLPDEPVGDVALQRRLRRGRDELARSPGDKIATSELV